MSRCTDLVLVLSLAACEHALPPATPPTFEPVPVPVAQPAPVVQPALAAPVVAPREAQPCRRGPRSRAGCRWKGERDTPRVVKQAVPVPARAAVEP
jgi:hypothetical protein